MLMKLQPRRLTDERAGSKEMCGFNESRVESSSKRECADLAWVSLGDAG